MSRICTSIFMEQHSVTCTPPEPSSSLRPQLYSMHPSCKTLTSQTEAFIDLKSPHLDLTPEGRRNSYPNLTCASPTSAMHTFQVPSNILADLLTETMKDTSSDDSTAAVNVKVISSASSQNTSRNSSGSPPEVSYINSHERRQEDMKIEIKIRIPSRNLNHLKISKDCRTFLQQLFDPFPWGRKNWTCFAELFEIPWFKKSEVSAESIVNKHVMPPFVPPGDPQEDLTQLNQEGQCTAGGGTISNNTLRAVGLFGSRGGLGLGLGSVVGRQSRPTQSNGTLRSRSEVSRKGGSGERWKPRSSHMSTGAGRDELQLRNFYFISDKYRHTLSFPVYGNGMNRAERGRSHFVVHH